MTHTRPKGQTTENKEREKARPASTILCDRQSYYENLVALRGKVLVPLRTAFVSSAFGDLRTVTFKLSSSFRANTAVPLGLPSVNSVAPSPGCYVQIDSPEKWRENMEMALEMFKAQKAMMQQEAGGEDEDDGAADVDDLDDD